MWLHSRKVAQLLRSAACLHTNQSRSYLNHLVITDRKARHMHRDNSILKMDQLDFEIFMSKGIEMLQLYHFTLDKIIVLS